MAETVCGGTSGARLAAAPGFPLRGPPGRRHLRRAPSRAAPSDGAVPGRECIPRTDGCRARRRLPKPSWAPSHCQRGTNSGECAAWDEFQGMRSVGTNSALLCVHAFPCGAWNEFHTSVERVYTTHPPPPFPHVTIPSYCRRGAVFPNTKSPCAHSGNRKITTDHVHNMSLETHESIPFFSKPFSPNFGVQTARRRGQPPKHWAPAAGRAGRWCPAAPGVAVALQHLGSLWPCR